MSGTSKIVWMVSSVAVSTSGSVFSVADTYSQRILARIFMSFSVCSNGEIYEIRRDQAMETSSRRRLNISVMLSAG